MRKILIGIQGNNMTNFKKTTLALIAASAMLSGNVYAGDKVTVYGKINATIQSDDTGESETKIKSNASRFGLKGGVKINEDLKINALKKTETQTETQSQISNLEAFNSELNDYKTYAKYALIFFCFAVVLFISHFIFKNKNKKNKKQLEACVVLS